MKLPAHWNATTHMRYVLIADRLDVPAVALPKRKAVLTLMLNCLPRYLFEKIRDPNEI